MGSDIKIIATNRKAHFEYFLSNALEAGIVLKGSEIKSLRIHGCSFQDSYIIIKGGEMFILGMHITPYDYGGVFNHEATRTRKLLLHENEIRKYAQKVKEKGYTIVATKAYFRNGKAKIEIALAKGKKIYDKKEVIKKRDLERENKNMGKIS